jgi:hypothetical protein
VLGIVEEGHRIVIAPDQQDLAVQLYEPFERRVTSVWVAPRLGTIS